MFPFSRSKNLKDIGERLRGKTRRYRLPRNGGTLAFTGCLLTFFRHQPGPAEPPYPPEVGYVDRLAVFRTRAGRFLIHYLVACTGHDELTERREYAHVCSDLPALRDFLGAMAYPNRARFLDRVLAEAGGETPPPVAAAPLPSDGPARLEVQVAAAPPPEA